MVFLILSALMSVLILITFRMFTKFRIKTLNAIMVNYFVCILTGILITGYQDLPPIHNDLSWVLPGLVIGSTFMLAFHLMAKTTQEFGLMVASVSSKISMVIPVLISLLVFQIKMRDYTPINLTGIFLALISVIGCSVIPGAKSTLLKKVPFLLLFPLFLFLLSGLIDTSVHYVNFRILDDSTKNFFPLALFSAAALTSSVLVFLKKQIPNKREWAGGFLLGIFNYFSLYFLLLALSDFNNDGAVVFPVLNMLVITVSTLAGAIFFREKLGYYRMAGLLTAFLAILFIFYQEIKVFILYFYG